MILDNNLIFDPRGTAITVTAVSTNVLDMGLLGITGNGRDIGIGQDGGMRLAIYSNGLFAAAGAGTLEIQVQGAPDNGSGSPGTYVTYASSGALSLAQLNSFVGTGNSVKLFPIALPPAEAGAANSGFNPPLPRFYRLNYVVATGPMTAGAIEAYLTNNRDDMVTYPSGFSTAGF